MALELPALHVCAAWLAEEISVTEKFLHDQELRKDPDYEREANYADLHALRHVQNMLRTRLKDDYNVDI